MNWRIIFNLLNLIPKKLIGKFVIDYLEKQSKKTDNNIDDLVISYIKEALKQVGMYE